MLGDFLTAPSIVAENGDYSRQCGQGLSLCVDCDHCTVHNAHSGWHRCSVRLSVVQAVWWQTTVFCVFRCRFWEACQQLKQVPQKHVETTVQRIYRSVGDRRHTIQTLTNGIYHNISPFRPSVCSLSHGWISQKRLKLGSCNFQHRV